MPHNRSPIKKSYFRNMKYTQRAPEKTNQSIIDKATKQERFQHDLLVRIT